MLGEKGIDVDLKAELYWERREEFLRLNPAGEVPVFIEEDSSEILSDATAIAEYIDEKHPDPPLMGATLHEGAEIRRIVAWFDKKFEKEVTSILTTEKVMKRFLKMGEPSSANIRIALQNLKTHMAYIGYLAERRNYLAGNRISIADLTAAAHISVVDYLGDINWEQWPEAKNWYVRVKSRPSFRALLADRIGGLTPPIHYGKLDF